MVRLMADHGQPDTLEQKYRETECLDRSCNQQSLLDLPDRTKVTNADALTADLDNSIDMSFTGHVNLAADLQDVPLGENSPTGKNNETTQGFPETNSQEMPVSDGYWPSKSGANRKEKKKPKMQLARLPETDSKQISLPADNSRLQSLARPDIIPYLSAGTPILQPPSAPTCERVLVHNSGRAAIVEIGTKMIINGPVTYISPEKKDTSGYPDIVKVENKKFPWSYLEGYSRRCKIFTVAAICLFVTISVLAAVLSSGNRTVPVPECPKNGSQIISRGEWFARKAEGPVPELPSPVSYVIITQRWALCSSVTSCSSIMLQCQQEAFSNNLADIKYNFVIGGDGNIYIGRGWTRAGNLTSPLDSKAVNIALLVGVYSPPTECQVNALTKILNEGLSNKNLTSDYKIVPLKNIISSVTVPNEEIIDAIKHFSHFIDKPLHEVT